MKVTTMSIDVKAKSKIINFKRNLALGLPVVLEGGTGKIGCP